MENKFYTPSIEEFYKGFEFEFLNRNNEWISMIYDYNTHASYFSDWDENSYLETYIEDGNIKAKYLDESDLEELGWNVHDKGIEKKVVGGEWRVNHLKPGTFELHYSDDVDWESGFELYDVKVKNKMEMKKLMQMLNII